jgi:hypothetical protein
MRNGKNLDPGSGMERIWIDDPGLTSRNTDFLLITVLGSVEIFFKLLDSRISPTGCRPPPPPSTGGKAGGNHLNEEITPLLPHWIAERFSQTVSNLGHAALLHRCELPPINDSAELTRVAL